MATAPPLMRFIPLPINADHSDEANPRDCETTVTQRGLLADFAGTSRRIAAACAVSYTICLVLLMFLFILAPSPNLFWSFVLTASFLATACGNVVGATIGLAGLVKLRNSWREAIAGPVINLIELAAFISAVGFLAHAARSAA